MAVGTIQKHAEDADGSCLVIDSLDAMVAGCP